MVLQEYNLVFVYAPSIETYSLICLTFFFCYSWLVNPKRAWHGRTPNPIQSGTHRQPSQADRDWIFVASSLRPPPLFSSFAAPRFDCLRSSSTSIDSSLRRRWLLRFVLWFHLYNLFLDCFPFPCSSLVDRFPPSRFVVGIWIRCPFYLINY